MISDLDREIIRQTIEKIREQVKKLNESIASLEDLIRDKTTENKFFSDSCKRMSFDGYSANNIFGSKYAEKIDDTSTDDILHMDFGNDMPDFGLFVKWMSNKMDDSFFIGHTKMILLDNNKIIEVEELASEQYSSAKECFREVNLNMLNSVKEPSSVLVGPHLDDQIEDMFNSKAVENKMLIVFTKYADYSIKDLIGALSYNNGLNNQDDIYIIGIDSMCYDSDVYESAEEEFLASLVKLNMTYKITYTKFQQVYPSLLTKELMFKSNYIGQVVSCISKDGVIQKYIDEINNDNPSTMSEALNAAFEYTLGLIHGKTILVINRNDNIKSDNIEKISEVLAKKNSDNFSNITDISELEWLIIDKHANNGIIAIHILNIDSFTVDYANYGSAEEQIVDILKALEFDFSITFSRAIEKQNDKEVVSEVVQNDNHNENSDTKFIGRLVEYTIKANGNNKRDDITTSVCDSAYEANLEINIDIGLNKIDVTASNPTLIICLLPASSTFVNAFSKNNNITIKTADSIEEIKDILLAEYRAQRLHNVFVIDIENYKYAKHMFTSAEEHLKYVAYGIETNYNVSYTKVEEINEHTSSNVPPVKTKPKESETTSKSDFLQNALAIKDRDEVSRHTIKVNSGES